MAFGRYRRARDLKFQWRPQKYRFDFAIKHDPATDSPTLIAKRIFRSIFLKRLQARKPVILGIFARSGEGKSFAALRLMELMCEEQGINFEENFDLMNVRDPAEYADKFEKILNSKKYPEYKHINIICMHEAREIIRAKKWFELTAQAVSDVNALSREVKPLMIIIISQYLKDITKEIRLTLTHYAKVRRPNQSGAHSVMQINVVDEDDTDIETPYIYKRQVQGYLRMPNGNYVKYRPDFEMRLPSKNIVRMFRGADRESKMRLIIDKLSKIADLYRKDSGDTDSSKKILTMIDYYSANPERLKDIGKFHKGKKGYQLLPKVRELHGIDLTQAKKFEDEMTKIMKQQSEEFFSLDDDDDKGDENSEVVKDA